MIISVISVYYFCVVAATNSHSDGGSYLHNLAGENKHVNRQVRDIEIRIEGEFFFRGYSCEHMGNTKQTPFVVILLFKSSGRFIGMGSIITRNTVLTAAKVIRAYAQTPSNILALAGRLSPWWGKDSQVKAAHEILSRNKTLALVKTLQEFIFNPYVGPITLVEVEVKDYVKEYTSDYGVFGIPRSSWDVPGDYVSQSARYLMKVETNREGEADKDACLTWFPDTDFNDKEHICTWANFSYTWGCLGSPTVAIVGSQAVQIAVLTKTADLPVKDKYHFHTKITPHLPWIKSYTHLDYRPF